MLFAAEVSKLVPRTRVRGQASFRNPSHAAFALLRVEDLTRNDLNQVLAKIADREPDFRLAT
jgi:hypothetical protein